MQPRVCGHPLSGDTEAGSCRGGWDVSHSAGVAKSSLQILSTPFHFLLLLWLILLLVIIIIFILYLFIYLFIFFFTTKMIYYATKGKVSKYLTPSRHKPDHDHKDMKIDKKKRK